MATTLWNIDPIHSGVHFTVRHMVFGKVRGRFTRWRGGIRMPADTPMGDTLIGGSVTVEIDAASIDTAAPARDIHLRSADFLDAMQFPTLRFVSTRVEDLGGDRYRLAGELTVRDVTRAVALELAYGGAGQDPWGHTRAAFSASTSFDRRDFGLDWNQALRTGGMLVGDRVDVDLDVEAVAPLCSHDN